MIRIETPGFAILALVISILCRSLAFVFAKYAAMESAGSTFVCIIVNPWYWAELLALGGQTVFWIAALRFMPLSLAYPAMAAVYAVNLGWSVLLFGEHVTGMHIAGIATIMFGIVLMVPATSRRIK
jgi:multidrug transporter EmrE-like cation transporter